MKESSRWETGDWPTQIPGRPHFNCNYFIEIEMNFLYDKLYDVKISKLKKKLQLECHESDAACQES